MQVSAIGTNYKRDLNNRQQSFKRAIYNTNIVTSTIKQPKIQNKGNIKNLFLSIFAAFALLVAPQSCQRNLQQDRMKQVEEHIYSQPKIDSAAWAAFEEWDEAHTPYWDKPGYDGPIYEEDFLAWQDSVNAWWDNYFKTHKK